ncbi:uncharacterized protein LOC103314145 isoform X2 [Tribolium castaneum]|uniref:uncharacterized protein LOC103314145 isoform X2 n=1 Tax=Tribolium castaneum TaxID=7070 RepID=UPI0030FE0065
MSFLTRGEMQFLKVAKFLGILQGFTYAILSLICIILYIKKDISFDVDSYMDTVSYYMYELFLSSRDYEIKLFKSQTMIPATFAIFAWIHFIFNLLWLGFSLNMSQQNHLKIAQKAKNWAVITLVVCLLDFITVVVLGADYGKCLDATKKSYISTNRIAMQQICANGFLPPLVIAAKGFTLWVVNLILAKKMFNWSKELRQGQVLVQPSVPVGFLTPQPQPVVPNAYVTQPQNVNRNQFEYPNVHIPEPDYHYQQNVQPHGRKY